MYCLIVAYSLTSTYASSSSQLKSKLTSLLLSSPVSRGYLPESEEISRRKVVTAVSEHPIYSEELKAALIARMTASYRMAKLIGPVVKVYGQLWAEAIDLDRQREFDRDLRKKVRHVREDLRRALKQLADGLNEILDDLISKHQRLPNWKRMQMAMKAKAARKTVQSIVAAVISSLQKLCRSPSMSVMEQCSDALAFDSLFNALQLFEDQADNEWEHERICLGVPPMHAVIRYSEAAETTMGYSKLSYLAWRCHQRAHLKYLEMFRDWHITDVSRILPKLVYICEIAGSVCRDYGNNHMPYYRLTANMFEDLEARKLYSVASRAAEKRQARAGEVTEALERMTETARYMADGSLHPNTLLAGLAAIQCRETIAINILYEQATVIASRLLDIAEDRAVTDILSCESQWL
jgi:hypothetical protein